MDRLAAHVVATAVLTAALAAVPAAMANPTPANPSQKPPTTAPLTVPPPPSAAPLPARGTHVELEPFPCPDVRQIGDTSYARWHGVVAFSVKLFYSTRCRQMYGYAYPWLQFRLLKVHYDLGMGVFDTTHDAIDGARTFIAGAGGPDFWSSPVSVPAGTCTQGLAHVFYPDTETDTFTAKFCLT